MFEVKGNLLMFNKLDKMGFIFPKNCCNVNIPDNIKIVVEGKEVKE